MHKNTDKGEDQLGSYRGLKAYISISGVVAVAKWSFAYPNYQYCLTNSWRLASDNQPLTL
jgi:hypothetical protein